MKRKAPPSGQPAVASKRPATPAVGINRTASQAAASNRPAQASCDAEQPATSRRGKVRVPDREAFTIKRGLQSFCKHQRVFDGIQENVEEASELIAEASIYIHHMQCTEFTAGRFPTGPIDILRFFNQLCVHHQRPTSAKYDISQTPYGRKRAHQGLS